MTGSPSFPDLSGQHVAVTGGASGIGAAIVKAFCSQDALVSFFDIDRDAGSDLAVCLGSQARFHWLDLTDAASIAAGFDHAARDAPFDILVNNAARDDRHGIAEVSPEYWRDRMAANLDHQFFCAQAVIPGMQTANRGCIINMGSIAWRVGLNTAPAYVTAKAAIEGLTHGLARALGPHGIRVNCLLPGFVRTERQVRKWLTPELESEVMDRQCLKRFIAPDEIASVVVMLASQSSAAITNQTIIVDAGWS